MLSWGKKYGRDFLDRQECRKIGGGLDRCRRKLGGRQEVTGNPAVRTIWRDGVPENSGSQVLAEAS